MSGGSIISGALASVWSELKFEDKTLSNGAKSKVASNIHEKLFVPMWDFCARTIDVSSFLKGVFSLRSSRGDELAKQYEKYLTRGKFLEDLPDDTAGPRFVFYGTNLQTGSSVRFQKKRIADYRLGEIPNPKGFPLAKAIAVSSAFPPVFSPVTLKFAANDWRPFPGADLFSLENLRTSMTLADGGVYDNMGLEAIWHRCKTVLVSDAGAPLGVEMDPGVLGQINTVRDILIEQTRALRKRWLIADFLAKVRAGTYWGIATQIGDYKLADPMVQDSAASARLKGISTRLAAFAESDRGQLVNWGYALGDAAIRKHLPEMIAGAATKPIQFPVPKFPLPT